MNELEKNPWKYCVSNRILRGTRTEVFETHTLSGPSLENRDKLDPYLCVIYEMCLIVTILSTFHFFLEARKSGSGLEMSTVV